MQVLIVVLIGAAVVGALAALIWLVKAYSAKLEAGLDAAWSQAAGLVGGRFTPPQGPWYNRKARTIDARVGQVAVLADHYTVSTGKTSVTYSRVRSRAASPQGMKLQVFRKHAFSGLGQALGFQDVPTGHRDFDGGFTVKSNAPQLVPLWLGPEVRQAVTQVPEYSFGLGDGEVVSNKVGIEQDPRVLAGAMHAVALLAWRGVWMLETWRSIAGELGGSVRAQHGMWTPGDGTSIHVAWHDVPVSIWVMLGEAGLLGGDWTLTTLVRARRARGERFCVGGGEVPAGLSRVPVETPGLQVWSDNPGRTLSRLSPETLGVLSALGPSRVEAEGEHVTLLIHGILFDVRHAALAVEIVGRLASGSETGPYR